MSTFVYIMQDYLEEATSRGQTRQVKIHPKDDNDPPCYATSVIIPCICLFGILGNILCIVVLSKYEKKNSYYTYLIVLSCSDLGNCILMLICGLTNGFDLQGKDSYDLVGMPLGSFFSGISVSATVAVTLDRLILLRYPTRPTPPKLCTKLVARRIMVICVISSFVLNLPYYFVFSLDDKGTIIATPFYNSRFYCVFNWFRLFIYGIVPAIFLTICTGLLIANLRRVSRHLRHLSCNSKTQCESNLVTFNLIVIVIFFLVGEVPGHLLSKKSAAIMLFKGNLKATFDDVFITARKVAAVLSAINVSSNFLLYFVMHPPFRRGLKVLLCGPEDKTTTHSEEVKIDVFVIKEKLEVSGFGKKFMILSDLVAWKNRLNNLS